MPSSDTTPSLNTPPPLPFLPKELQGTLGRVLFSCGLERTPKGGVSSDLNSLQKAELGVWGGSESLSSSEGKCRDRSPQPSSHTHTRTGTDWGVIIKKQASNRKRGAND